MANIYIGTQSPYFTQWCKNVFTIVKNAKNFIKDITSQCNNIAKTYKKANIIVKDGTISELIQTFNETQTKLPVTKGQPVPTTYNTIGELVVAMDTYVDNKNLEVQ